MGICSFGRQLWALCGEPCLWGVAALVGSYGPCLGSRVMGICSFGRQLWALFGEPCLWGFAALVGSHGPCLGSRVYRNLQLWSAVMGLVWGAVSMGISSFGRQSWALFGEPRLWGLAALVGSYGPCLGSRVWGAVSIGISSFGRQLWALFGEPCLWGFAALVGSYEPCQAHESARKRTKTHEKAAT